MPRPTVCVVARREPGEDAVDVDPSVGAQPTNEPDDECAVSGLQIETAILVGVGLVLVVGGVGIPFVAPVGVDHHRIAQVRVRWAGRRSAAC